MKKNICILGSTGSIGQNTLNVIAQHPQQFSVFALSGHANVTLLLQQCQQFKPKYAVMTDEEPAQQLKNKIEQYQLPTQVLSGAQALETIVSFPEVDSVMAAIVGGIGMRSTLAAARAGKRILLANKEALIMAGEVIMKTAQHYHAEIIPVDSEHNAIFQAMPAQYRCGEKPLGVNKIILTASGGPFREWAYETLASVTPEQACAHPNWSMGKKISVDSATMMNKALEVIEAHWLFQQTSAEIEVVLHPQSIIHSLVEYADGSLLAQLGQPDMRIPIACALSWPARITSGVKSLNLIECARLDFESIDEKRFPGLQLAYRALELGGFASAILNAANEVAVMAFLQEKIRFTDIVHICEMAMTHCTNISYKTNNTNAREEMAEIEMIIKADRDARSFVNEYLQIYNT
ncbi:MAG: 1-deoxy-D-xylulose-5-phosphate reductoisomerase [Legionellales bacterium]|nr:1-deoxy-D-xylulose-5-phosphate reductoisomerase [Legionellales bacterium]